MLLLEAFRALIVMLNIKLAYGNLSCGQGNTTCSVILTNFTLNKVKALPNPFKGFVPYTYLANIGSSQINQFPFSLQNQYFPMSALMTGPSSFDFSSIQSILSAIDSRGHQAIIRVYADYPNQYTGQKVFIPNYLVGTVSLCTYTIFGGGKSPDYNHPSLITAMVALINKLGQVYDGDRRIAVFQTGFLGHWGEQHTQPPCSFANDTTVTTIFRAFMAAFVKTKLQIRYPNNKGTIATADLKMGYHDDSFTQDTLFTYSWYFSSRLVAANAVNQWKLYPIGGELRPEFWICIFGQNITSSCADATTAAAAQGDNTIIPEDINTCINAIHISWAWDLDLFKKSSNISPAYYQRALIAAGNMGYSFNLLSSQVVLKKIGSSWVLDVSVVIRNDGVAPFYYDLTLNVVVESTKYPLTSNSSLSFLLPGVTASLASNNIPATPPIEQVYLKFTSSDTSHPIKFAVNEISNGGILYIDGQYHPEDSQSKVPLALILGVSIGGFALILGIIIGSICWKKKKQIFSIISENTIAFNDNSRKYGSDIETK